MNRANRKKDAQRISLFPFLAVLICTMGALLVLLVVLAQRAQARARAATEPEPPADQSEAIAELEKINADIEELSELRDKTAAALASRRQSLSHVEDHMRRLNEQIQQLRSTAAQLRAAAQSETADREKLATELQRLRKQLEESEQLLREALEAAKTQKPSFAIVPYEGRNGTRRRPIYIECLTDTIVLQPEGITLTEADFVEPLGPDNPLAATVRAAAQHMRDQSAAGNDLGEPYPLLIVRPKGIAAYYGARKALKSWDEEFGYELVSSDWDLEFPLPDPILAQAAQEALERARQRHRMAIRHQRATRRAGQPKIASGRGFDRVIDEGSSGKSADDSSGTDGTEPGESPGESFGTPSGGTGDVDAATPPDTPTEGQPGGSGSGSLIELPPGASPSTPVDGSNVSRKSGGSTEQSMAETRGNDWALPNASKGSVPFTRPIRIECRPHSLVIVGADSRTGNKVIPLRGTTREGIEQFVSAVWDHMRTWGIAGRGLYWRPVLNLHALPGGQQRAWDVAALLKNSGLDVKLQPGP